MKNRQITFVALLILLRASSLLSQSNDTSIADTNFINDEAHLLTMSQRESIQDLLVAHNHTHLGRVCLETIAELPNNVSIDKYALQRINRWPLAVNERVDRILIVIAIRNRTMRIETSLDVWKILDDKSCSEIISNKFTPSFKKQKYFQGIQMGIKSIIKKLEES